MGEEVLEGLKGVELVNKEFHNFKETNTVWYDPALINIDPFQPFQGFFAHVVSTDKENNLGQFRIFSVR